MLVRMVAHDALQSSLFTDFNAIELESEHLCAVIGRLGMEKEVVKPLEGEMAASRKDMIGDNKRDFVTDAIGELDVLPDIVVERVGWGKRGSLVLRGGVGLAEHGGRCALESLYGEVAGTEIAIKDWWRGCVSGVSGVSGGNVGGGGSSANETLLDN